MPGGRRAFCGIQSVVVVGKGVALNRSQAKMDQVLFNKYTTKEDMPGWAGDATTAGNKL